MAKVAEHYGICHHQYADDTQVYVSLSRNDLDTPLDNLQRCLHLWLSQNGLVVNPDKSEAILLSTAIISPLPVSDVNVAGSVVPIRKSSISVNLHIIISELSDTSVPL